MEDNQLPNLFEHLEPIILTETQKKINKLQRDEEAQKTRTWSWYQEIRKKDPHKYLMPKMQAQMFRDAAALGDKFADGDYHDL